MGSTLEEGMSFPAFLFIVWIFYKIASSSNFTIIQSLSGTKFYKSNIKLISTFKVYPPPNKTLQKWSNKRKCLKCIKQKVDHVVLTGMGKNKHMWEQGKNLNSCTKATELAVLVLRVLFIPLLHCSFINCTSFETTASLLSIKSHPTSHWRY